MAKRRLQPFPANRPLELVFIDILIPFPKISSDRQHLFIMTEHYLNLTTALPIARKIDAAYDCIPQQLHSTVWQTNASLDRTRPAVRQQILYDIMLLVGPKMLMIMADHHHKNCRAELYNHMPAARDLHCVSNH